MLRSGAAYLFSTVSLLGHLSQISAFSSKYLTCQLQKPEGESPLTGCPQGTIYVSATDPNANFTGVQDAVLSLDDDNEAVILIGEGEYFEVVNVTRPGPLTLLGQLNQSSVDSSSNATSRNLVHVWYNIYDANGEDDAVTAVLLVAPNWNASLIGSGTNGAPLQSEFGNVDFKAYNIDFENRAAEYAISQALVTDISYANASFYGCVFASYQDTWYTGRNGSTYVVDSIIYGQTDFLFGFGTAWFQNVTLAIRDCGGGIVAWKGSNASIAPINAYGAYISDSQIIRSPDANATLNITDGCWLGRPWNDWATTVYMNTYMEDIIQPAGFEPFGDGRDAIANTTYYAEYDSYGPGGNTSERVSIEHILDSDEVAAFTIESVFFGLPSWIDYDYESSN